MATMFGPKGIDFSPDDALWVAERPVSELIEIMFDPVKWAATRADEYHDLRSPYVIRIQPIDPGNDPTDTILIQGIDRTNVLTIQPSPDAAKFLEAAFVGAIEGNAAAWWPKGDDMKTIVSEMGALPKAVENGFFTTLCLDETGTQGKAFIHFPVFVPEAGMAKEDVLFRKSTAVSQFHLNAARDPLHLHNAVMAGANAGGLRVFKKNGDTMARTMDFDRENLPKFLEPVSHIPLLYCGETGSSQEACEILVARYKNGEIKYEEAYCKAYA